MTPFTHAPQLARMVADLSALQAQIRAQAGARPSVAEVDQAHHMGAALRHLRAALALAHDPNANAGEVLQAEGQGRPHAA